MQTSHKNLVELMREQVAEHKTTNAKINILYANIYGDKDPIIVPISGITIEDVIRKSFESQNVQLQIAQAIKKLESNVSTLFSAQELSLRISSSWMKPLISQGKTFIL